MSRNIQNVVIAGATGSAGSKILKALAACEVFNVTAIVRRPSLSLPGNVTVRIVDLDSYDELVEVFKNQDAVVDATMSPDAKLPLRMIEAAVAAGVARFIPSEYSLDPNNLIARAVPVYHFKNQVMDCLKHLAEAGKLTYTSISNGAFLDWNLRTGFFKIDLKNKKAELMSGGANVVPWTLLEEVGKAVVSVLLNPGETKNRALCISNVDKSQKEMLELAQVALGKEGWEISTLEMGEVYQNSLAQLTAGNVTFEVMGNMILYCNTNPVMSGPWKQNDNALLGIKTMEDDEIINLMQSIASV